MAQIERQSQAKHRDLALHCMSESVIYSTAYSVQSAFRVLFSRNAWVLRSMSSETLLIDS